MGLILAALATMGSASVLCWFLDTVSSDDGICLANSDARAR
jgi:hypothetical protein